MAEYEDSKSVLVADVDCTGEGKSLCAAQRLQGYPTLKFGDPNDLQEYKGRRSLNALQEFAEENLVPTCGPFNLDLCDDEQKALVKKYQAMSDIDLEDLIQAEEQKIAAVEEAAKKAITELGETYLKDFTAAKAANEDFKPIQVNFATTKRKYEDEKKEKIKSIKDSGLDVMRNVVAYKEDRDEL